MTLGGHSAYAFTCTPQNGSPSGAGVQPSSGACITSSPGDLADNTRENNVSPNLFVWHESAFIDQSINLTETDGVLGGGLTGGTYVGSGDSYFVWFDGGHNRLKTFTAEIDFGPGVEIVGIMHTSAAMRDTAYLGDGSTSYRNYRDAFSSPNPLESYELSNGRTSWIGGVLNTKIQSWEGQDFYRIITKASDPAPVPLPAAVWLPGSALTGLGVFRRRKATA